MRSLRAALLALRAALPQGRALPESAWRPRHQALVWVLVLHTVGLATAAVALGFPLVHAGTEALPLVVLALLGARSSSRAVASSAVSAGLVLSSVLLLHVGGGHTVLHFHFFLVVALLALYQDWLPFCLALGLVLVDHGVLGFVSEHQVYDDPWSLAHPVTAAAVHAGFLLAVAVVHVVTWGWAQRERDSAERRIAAQAAQVADSERRLAEVIDNAPALIFVKDLEGRLVRVNPRFAHLHQSAPEALLGKSADELFGHATGAGLSASDRHVLETGQSLEHDARLLFPSGERVLQFVKFPLLDVDGLPYALGGVGIDITDRADAQEALGRQAREDALTGLPNRTALHERLAAALASDRLVGLAFLDLDGFKEVNDSLGHEAGDELLRLVAARLLGAVRVDDVLHRLGGDEFVLLLPDITSPDEAVAVVQQLVRALEGTFPLGERTVTVGVSSGVTTGRGADGVTGSTMLRDADIALYESKARRRGGVTAYDPAFHVRDERRRRLEADLAAALRGGSGLSLVYQPIADPETGAWTLVEALLRWAHPADGSLSPAEFLPIAAGAGLLDELDRWVVHQACTQLAQWAGQGLDLAVSVNVTPTSLADGRVGAWVREACGASGASPERLVVELTETAVVEHPAAASAALSELRAMGVRIALDDFGTGFSSLSLLRDLPVDIVKIDRSFVVGATERDAAIVRATTGLAEALGLLTVAEGVEDVEVQGAALAAGCRLVQGWHVGRPVPADAIAASLANPRVPHPRKLDLTDDLRPAPSV